MIQKIRTIQRTPTSRMYQSVLLDTDSTETYSMKLFMAPLGLQDTKTIFFRNGEFLNALMTCGSEIWANFSLNHWICLINDIQSELCKKPSFWLDYVDNEKSPQIQIYFTQYLNWYTCISTYIYKHTSRKTKATPLIMIDSILYSISCISDWLLLKTCKCTWFTRCNILSHDYLRRPALGGSTMATTSCDVIDFMVCVIMSSALQQWYVTLVMPTVVEIKEWVQLILTGINCWKCNVNN